MYVYPAQSQGSADLMTSENVPIPEEVKFLYQHLLGAGQIVDIKGFKADQLHIFSKDVLVDIRAGNDAWEVKVPPAIAAIIKERCLFGYPAARMEFEY